MSIISFEIKEKIGTLSESSRGWTKELRRINWNGRGDKYDIREWSPDQRKMGKGVTFSARELLSLSEMLEKMRPDLEREQVQEGRQPEAGAGGPEPRDSWTAEEGAGPAGISQ